MSKKAEEPRGTAKGRRQCVVVYHRMSATSQTKQNWRRQKRQARQYLKKGLVD